MTKPRTPQVMSEETRRQKALEADRLATALRDNLRRRKQQARARAEGDAAPDTPTAESDAGGSHGG
jgi:hypothetical protein